MANTGEQVVVLHGIARSSRHMRPLARFLSTLGYEVSNLDYPSTRHNLTTLTDIIVDRLTGHVDQRAVTHFVGYSMGGLLTRAIIHRARPLNLGRVVQLAPPNGGSEIADFLQYNALYRWYFGPAGQELTTEQAGNAHLFGPVDFELGIIAGNRSLDPLSSMIIEGPDDGKVSVNSTKLRGMRDHITVEASHLLFPKSRQVHHHTACFLRNGCFDHDGTYGLFK